MKHLRHSVCIAACLGWGIPAHAIDASAGITNFAIQVIDLTPGDGIAAGYSFSDGVVTLLQTVARSSFSHPPVMNQDAAGTWFGAVQSQAVDGTSTSSASSGLGSMEVTGKASALNSYFYTDASRFDDAFTIFPNTQLVFTGDFRAAVSAVDCYPNLCRPLYSYVAFALYQSVNGENIVATNFALQPNREPSVHEQVSLSYSTADAEWVGNMSLRAIAAGAVPVPEPETWALLAAGLGVVAWRVRRSAAKAR
jgi:hypothetical protein